MIAQVTTVPKQLKKKGKQIVDIYNEFTGNNEKLTLKSNKTSMIAYIDGVPGGVFLEIFHKSKGIIYYAAFNESDRGKGYLKKCIKALEQHYTIYGVEVNPFDNWDLWKHLGFVNQYSINWTPVLSQLCEKHWKELWHDAKCGELV